MRNAVDFWQTPLRKLGDAIRIENLDSKPPTLDFFASKNLFRDEGVSRTGCPKREGIARWDVSRLTRECDRLASDITGDVVDVLF